MHNRFGYRFTGRLDIATWIERKQQAAETAEIICAVTRAAAPTVLGEQTITTPDLGGLTPKAVLIIANYAIADAVAAAHNGTSIGVADGTRQWVATSNTEDAVAAMDVNQRNNDGICVLINVAGTAVTLASATFSAFVENGVTLDWTNVDAAYLVTYVFFAGADLSVYADDVSLGNAVDNVIDIAAPAFEPDLVIATVLDQQPIDTGGGRVRHAFGFISNDGAGGIVQTCAGATNPFGSNPSRAQVFYRTDCGVAGMTDFAVLDWRGVFSDFDDNGFTVTTDTNGANNSALMYLALKLGGKDFWVGEHATPTLVGNNSDIGPGLEPQLLLRVMSMNDVPNSRVNTGDRSGSWGVSAMDADEAYSSSGSVEDNVSPTNDQSLSDDVAIELPDDDGTVGLTATFVSFDANGWTENYTAVKGVACLMPALAIAE